MPSVQRKPTIAKVKRQVPVVPLKKMRQQLKKMRKYPKQYLDIRLSCAKVSDEVRPLCLISAAVLKNEALKPAKRNRHKRTHPECVRKQHEIFSRKRIKLNLTVI